MGVIEETGAAQHYRDAMILTIYEGTTAILGQRPGSSSTTCGKQGAAYCCAFGASGL